MKKDRTSTVLTWLAAAMLILGAVIGTIVINDVVSWMPKHEDVRGDYYLALCQGYSLGAMPGLVLTIVMLCFLTGWAAMLFGFVTVRRRQLKESGNGAMVPR